MLKKYIGYKWGWITSEGVRCKPNGLTNALPDKIIGIWGSMTCKDQEPVYNETFLAEYVKDIDKKAPSSWLTRPLAMLIKTNMAQTYALANIGNKDLLFANDVISIPQEEKKQDVPKYRLMSKWKCSKCEHSFYTYTPYYKRSIVPIQIKSMLKSNTTNCNNCNERTAKKVGVVKKLATNKG